MFASLQYDFPVLNAIHFREIKQITTAAATAAAMTEKVWGECVSRNTFLIVYTLII